MLVRNCSQEVMNMKWINKSYEHKSANTLDINQRLLHIFRITRKSTGTLYLETEGFYSFLVNTRENLTL